jgi:hypothetical protein
MKRLVLIICLVLVASACKSKVCECADIHIKAVKEINAVDDPIKKMKILASKKYKAAFEKCNKMTESMTPEELKAFEEEYNECPSFKEFKSKEETK